MIEQLAGDSPAPWPARRRRPAGYAAGTLVLPVFHLRHLLAAGVPLADALLDVAALEPRGRRRTLWAETAAHVASGTSLSGALAAHPGDIDATTLALVRAGEASGRLSELLADLEEHLRWRDDIGARLRTATLYPAFATLLLLGVVGFLLGHVVPGLVAFLDGGGTSLAWHGAILLKLSSFVGGHGVTLLAVSMLPVLAFAFAPRLGEHAHALRDACVLRASGIGRLIAALHVARWARTAALLYGSGIALERALRIAEGTLGNRALLAEFAGARQALLGGVGLGAALGECRSMPPTLARLIAAGESAGALELALHHGAAQLQSSSRQAIARLETLLGPALLCLTGALLLWIVVSVLAPLYTGVTDAGFA